MKRYRYFAPDAVDTLGARLTAWRQSAADMGVFVLLAEKDQGRIGEIQSTCRALGVPVVGGVFPALVTEGGIVDRGLVAFVLDPMPPWCLIGDLDAAGDDAAARLADEVSARLMTGTPATERPQLFLAFDALIPHIGTILDGLYERLENTVSYSGVNVGSESFEPIASLFDGERSVTHGVLGFFWPAATEVVARHEYTASPKRMQATTTCGNCVDTIDDRPAIEAYRQQILAEYGVDVTAENFYQHAVHFPLGMASAFDCLVRIPVALDADGSLRCVGEIPERTALQVLKAPALEDSRCVAAIGEALAGGDAAGSVLVFYCAGRCLHFGREGADVELAGLRERVAVGGMCGALSLGEIVSDDDQFGMPRFHNAAIVCIR
ncbi:Uncharacterized conserved protein, contains FIST_N domain [Propionivibrio dicarboxylicus]|uniref:Uncharacterized conserved protein, contains FIST_N domain n=1 Tax=Propionivibrio dicarboxylicus TaxID=83767 RepID=A0A1G8BFU5_9RHOO|nr:Uncharacterized conserved protein, contains FIST_N domain [Propionivibrio dicarboxylicus]